MPLWPAKSGVFYRICWPEARRARDGPARGLAAVDEGHALGPGAGVVPEEAADGRGDGEGAGLADAPHRHAEVFGFDDDQDAARLQDLFDGVGHLGGEPLLDL